MKNQIKVFVFCLAAASASIGSAQAISSSDGVKARPTEVPRLTRHELIEKLQLTDDQKKQIRETRASYRTSVTKIENDIKLKNVELENELDKPESDQTKIDLLTGQLGVLYGQRLNVRVKASIELEKKILTPQQADELKSLQVKDSSASDEIL